MKITAGTPWAPYLLVFVSALLAGPGTLIGQDEPDTLQLATAVTIAREINPTLRASILSADAAAERVSRVGALPDPVLMLGLMNWSTNDFSPSEPMSMNAIQLSQREWRPLQPRRNLFTIGDYNVCGLEDSYLTGLFAANKIIEQVRRNSSPS